MNNLIFTLEQNIQIEEVLIHATTIEVFLKGEDESMTFDKFDFYDYLRADGWVRDYEGRNDDSQFAEYEQFDYRFNNFDPVFHFILEEKEAIEHRQHLAASQLPDLTSAFNKFKAA